MITEQEKAFFLSTAHTTLLLRVNEIGKVVTEHYGARISPQGAAPMFAKHGQTNGRTIVYDAKKDPLLSLNDIASDFSTPLKSDQRTPSIRIESEKSYVYDFCYVSHEIKEPSKMEGYPTPRGASEELVIYLEETKLPVALELHYLVYEEADVIGRYVRIINKGERIVLRKVASMQLVLEDEGYKGECFYGNWAGEFQESEFELGYAKVSFGSDSGSSGDYHNPLFLLKKENCSLRHGECYGFNLVYSGNHLAEIEKDSYGKVRVIQGISPSFFAYPLEHDESFLTPMAVLTYSNEGINGISHHFHRFVNSCVVPERFAYKDRPVCFNNWEGTYMKFDEGKIKSLAKKAASLGVELFILDDGWFGHRDDDKSSLGDWTVYKKKLTHGVEGIASYVHKLGMQFGLWFEPEAISEDSELYENHPDWAIKDGIHDPSYGRNQLILDLTRADVRDYLFDAMSKIIVEAKVDFVKWDYNRTFSDLPADGTFCHRYILGLYELLERLVAAFPDLLMENCASGGGRNDLAMFSYFPQGWVSDDTDSFERAKMQMAMAIGYPQSVMSNHVAAKTSNQMLRKTSFGTKFDVASIGILGYEMDIHDLDPIDEKEIKAEIELYKKYRHTLQFGEYDLLSKFEQGKQIIEVHDDKAALVNYVNFLQTPHPPMASLPLTGLDPEATYSYRVRKEDLNFKNFGSLVNHLAPIHIKEEGKIINFISRRFGMGNEKFEGELKGDALNAGALKLGREWAAVGLDDTTRILFDFGARLYVFDKVEKKD